MATTKKTPARVTTKKVSKTKETTEVRSYDEKFEIPNVELDLEFFMLKGDSKLSGEELAKMIFGEELAAKLTPSEQVYHTLKALESFELAMPFEAECPECHKKNPFVVELAKVMRPVGESLQKFVIRFDDERGDEWLFAFERPEQLPPMPAKFSMASLGLIVMAWCVGHNRGEGFEFIKMPIKLFVKLCQEFTSRMFGVEFKFGGTCHYCKHQFDFDFSVAMDELALYVNEL